MYTLFLFSLFAFGVFGGDHFGFHTWNYTINATSTPTITIMDLNEDTPPFNTTKFRYLALHYSISEHLNISSVDGDESYFLDFFANTPKPSYLAGVNFYGPISGLSSSGLLEPCGHPGLQSIPYSISFNHTVVTNTDDNLEGWGTLSISFEDTLIPELPYEDYFFTEGNGKTIYRTVLMPNNTNEDEQLKPKELMVKISTFSVDLSEVITGVILATGDNCIERERDYRDYISEEIPEKVREFNITVPAKDVWYIGLRSVNSRVSKEVKMELLPLFSASFIPSLDLLLMISLFLSFIVYHQ
jgi:hypothetical protein